MRPGRYVLYWMQASQRTNFNHALEHAITRANELNLPPVVCFALMDDYPEPDYDSYSAVPRWARQTLREHRAEPRPAVYTPHQLERADTHDELWNAGQREMTLTGYMHNSMRMYWGKKILEWKRSPQEAFADTLYLNNRYFLCGRDPVSYANVAWVFGLHDRPWKSRPIFGTVRYMNAGGLRRKFDMPAYLTFVAALEREATG